LVKDGHLPGRLDAYATGVRKLGNIGTHSFSDWVTEEDVYQSLTQLLPILDWYIECEGPTQPSLSPSNPGRRPPSEGLAERGQARRPAGISPPTAGNADNLLHLMWECLDPSLQDAFSLAYNKKRRQGGNRISTKDFFQALGRLRDDSVQSLIASLPEGARPDAVDTGVSGDRRLVLQESPLLSDCVADSLEHFKELDSLPRKVSPADMFVDIAKHGHGESVARLRAHGIGEKEIEERVRKLGLTLLRRKGGL
jgi:hypothetical protein